MHRTKTTGARDAERVLLEHSENEVFTFDSEPLV